MEKINLELKILRKNACSLDCSLGCSLGCSLSSLVGGTKEHKKGRLKALKGLSNKDLYGF
jgi:hypothetical protein